MRCDNCIALRDDSGYEHNSTDFWCAVGEEEREFADGSCGCLRKSKEKLKNDINLCNEADNKDFAEECSKIVDYFENELNV